VTGLDGVDERVVRTLLEPGARTSRAGLELHETPGARWLAVRTETLAGVPGWRAVMAISEQEAYGALRRLRKLLVMVFGLVLGGATAVSVVALRQAARPLVDVSSSMARVAGGDLTTRLPQGYRGELGQLVSSFNTMVSEVARSHDALKRTEALRRELQIAQALQTGILPRDPALAGFEVAARMKPAENVGGDLYDILSFPDSFWVLIGDVSGHGLQSGLVMLMAQAAAYSAISSHPGCTPREVLGAVNRVLHENVRRRMCRDDYLTLTVARHAGDGRFVAAGAHQPLFLVRAGGGVDVLEPSGPWCGVMEEVEALAPQFEFQLDPGDQLCLITDGIVEARGAADDLYGQDRLTELLARRHGSAPELLGAIFSAVEAFAASQEDDMTAVVLKRRVLDVRA
jgi:phosphoserine phosphatase RsbU/P